MNVPDIVKTYVETFSRGDLGAWLATWGSEGTYSDPNVPAAAAPAELEDYFRGLFTAFPDLTFETVALDAVSESLAVWRWVGRGTNTGPFQGLPATGRSGSLYGCEFIEARHGKIQKVEGYFDRLTLLENLGLAPAPADSTR